MSKTLNELETQVMLALATKKGYVEADPEVVDFLFKNSDWRKDLYIHYKGVKVYMAGKKEEADRRDARQVGEILHGDKSVVLGR